MLTDLCRSLVVSSVLCVLLTDWFYLFFVFFFCIFFFSSRRRHTSSLCDWSSDGALPISIGATFGEDLPAGSVVAQKTSDKKIYEIGRASCRERV